MCFFPVLCYACPALGQRWGLGLVVVMASVWLQKVIFITVQPISVVFGNVGIVSA